MRIISLVQDVQLAQAILHSANLQAILATKVGSNRWSETLAVHSRRTLRPIRGPLCVHRVASVSHRRNNHVSHSLCLPRRWGGEHCGHRPGRRW